MLVAAFIAGFPLHAAPGLPWWLRAFLVVPMFFWLGCPCCGETCTICSDDFNRANNTDLNA